MGNLLLKWYLKNDIADLTEPRVRARVGALSGLVGIVCNIALFLLKGALSLLSGSLAVMADALNNLSDASGSIVTLIGFRLADKPADEHHPFGHARFEYLSALGVAVLILFIGLELAKSSVSKILNPTPVAFSALTVVILICSIAVKLWLCLFNRHLGTLIRSRTLFAASADSRNDCIATAAVLAAALVQHFFRINADGWLGLGVAGFILFSGWQLARDTCSTLLGEGADPELRSRIVDYIAAQPKVLGYHDLMVHDYGPGKRFASIHVEMDRSEDPYVCHELIDDMERECLRSHNVQLVIHYDPVITDDPELQRLRQVVTSILQVRDSRLDIHDFRMSPGKDTTRLSFDVNLPRELTGREAELTASLEQALNSLGTTAYQLNITFDPGA